jgi:hypothetical protein
MFYNNYINYEFSDYLNRYCKGIIALRDKLKKISVSYELADAFSNYTCRFYIDVDFLDYDSLSENEKQMSNKLFHNMWNSTGSKFVSFSYKPQRSYNVDIEEIRSFITHYLFAKHLFEGFIKDILPEHCLLEITSIEREPLFNYTDYFLSRVKYTLDERDFEKQYRTITNRGFEFDHKHHNMLVNAAEKFSKIEIENSVLDKELFDAGGCDIEDLRRFVLNEGITFNIDQHRDVITEIRIEINGLKEKMKHYTPSNYVQINPAVITRVLEQKKKEYQRKQVLSEQLKKESGIYLGDYIVAERDQWGKECLDVGLVKEITLGYSDQLEVKYNVLKIDLQVSKLPSKSTAIENISYSIRPQKIEEEKRDTVIRQKFQLMRLLREKGYQNPIYKSKNKKSKSN